MKTWTREEMQAFLDSIRAERNYPLYYLALYTGMRRGELLGLRWEDIRWDAQTIAVQTQAGQHDNDDEEDAYDDDDAPTKSRAGRRAIKLDAAAIELLKDQRAAQEFERRSWGPAYRDHGLVFCRPDGIPHHPDTITSQFERLVQRARVKRIRFHDMRHTHATLALESGADISVVSRRLGHASVRTTADLYTHATDRLQQEFAHGFGAYVSSGDPALRDQSVTNPDSGDVKTAGSKVKF